MSTEAYRRLLSPIIYEIESLIQISPDEQYYKINGVYYDYSFPINLALKHKSGTGPNVCKNCEENGTLNGVFIMYCNVCANKYRDTYYGDESIGFGSKSGNGKEYLYSEKVYQEHGFEIIDDLFFEIIDDHHFEIKPAWETYLKNRDLTRIGLPEELKKIDFNRPGFEYVLVYQKNDNGELESIYPDFISISLLY
jgi:hypothetical protein